MIQPTEAKFYMIKVLAAMVTWEEANGHDFMADELRKVIPNLLQFGLEGNGTILDRPEFLADFICQAYQDHINEHYLEPLREAQQKLAGITEVPDMGAVTVVRDKLDDMATELENMTEGVGLMIDELDEYLRNDPS
jgi:hypothetical protein